MNLSVNQNVFANYTDKETFEKITLYKCVTDMWEDSVKEYSGREALAMEGVSVTYDQLDSCVAAFRSTLVKFGVGKGDKVGIYAPNGIKFAKAYLAVTTLGAIAVLLPPHLDSATVFGCSMKFGLKALVYDDSLAANLEVVKANNPALPLIEAGVKEDYPTPSVSVDADAPCTVIFTGGTTGKSKGSLLSNRSIMNGVRNGCYGIKNVFGEKYILVLPLTHVFGLVRNLLTTLRTGSSLFICSSPKNLFRDAAVFKPTIIVLVPALAEMALNLSKKFGKNMLGESIKTIICGAAFVPPYLISEYEKIGITLLPGYGMTETACLVSGNPESKRKPDSVGFIYPGIEAKIVEGELWLKGDPMQDCYIGEPEENAIAYEDGWFKTGDLVRYDDEGFLYITGRKKEIIVLRTGENVSPAELEAKFETIDAIQDCLVYENDRGTLELEVFIRDTVVAANNIEDPKAHINAEVKKINETLPAFERITGVVFRETDFVRSPSMKIVRSKNGNVKK